MEVLCIIPARGGSERVHRKNLASINGKPLIAWTIEAAIQSKKVSRTVVSTDDSEIAVVASRYGAEVVERPAGISGSTASSEAALLHVLNHLLENDDYTPELVVFLQATSPLRRDNDIDEAIELLIERAADTLLSVSATPGFLWRVDDGTPTAISFDPDNRPRSQELKDRFVIENGSLYVFKASFFAEHKNRLGGKIVAYYQPHICAFDIDEQSDLNIVDSLMGISGLTS